MLFNWKEIKLKYTTTLVSLLILGNVITLSGFAYRINGQQKVSVNTEWQAKFKRTSKTLSYKKHCIDKLRSKTIYDTHDFTFALLFYNKNIEQCYKTIFVQQQTHTLQNTSTLYKLYNEHKEADSPEYEMG
ncbi:hypothetical protein [Carboxylicivirga sp. N1Y90]|uniref:hypothetical protein n=1 Tax=Carboxylicivirga fragile TaxID=3417571 RepID=UPI003D34194B|nr:hypothetical protein [Marinilabiliaceae bacterium N1Y90]